MTKEVQTTIQKIDMVPGQRLLVLSDIHGHFNRLIQLLKKMEYGGNDVLVIVGDLIEKGPESLRTVQYVMDLCRQHPVYVSMGNVDLTRLKFLFDDSPNAAERFVKYLQSAEKYWSTSLCQEMLADLGIGIRQVNVDNAFEYMVKIRENFREVLDFLWSRPTILTAGKYLFVHGGVPTDDLTALEGSDAFPYLKNDNFLSQGRRFENYTVVTGHWPTSLYRSDREDVSPLFDYDRRILCIDGGCGLKSAGQLNGIIVPDCEDENSKINWVSYDDFPIVTALETRAEVPATFHLEYFDCKVELLEENGSLAKIRHLSSGEVMEVPLNWLWHQNDELRCSDCCNRVLPVEAGEQLSVVYDTEDGHYVKKQGQLGWYDGAVKPMEIKLQLAQGSPSGDCWRRERESAVYELLDRLGIAFERVDHCEANTMETCRAIDEILDAVICKNLFLCNQQRTNFYLLMMPGDKKFKTKELSKQINSSRLSFAEAVYMEQFLHISPGSVSVMGLMNDTENQVQLLIDKDVLKGEWFGCHPCMNTSSIRMRLADLLDKFLPAVHHEPVFVDLAGEDS